MKSSLFVLAGAVAAGIVVGGCASVPTECGCGNSPCSCFEGRWAFEGNNWWMGVEKDASGAYKATILWGGGSPIVQDKAVVVGDALVISSYRNRGQAAAYGKNAPELKPEAQRHDRTTMRVKNDVATLLCESFDGNGRTRGTVFHTAKRIPALPPAPNLAALKFGAPIDLMAGGMAGWEAMGDTTKRHFGWTMKDGVLSNRIARKPDGSPKRGDLNIKTKRADFEDFKIAYDVRVLPDCNSGVYLRGIYELQVLDSYGKPANCHNMAAPYGRIVPTATAEKPANEWQHVEAILCDRHVTVTLNGVKIVDNKPLVGVTGGALTSNEFVPGPIYLQGDHSDADFRNMILTPIVK